MKRDSRFELLRIVSMFLIILFHFEYFSQTWRVGSTNNFFDNLLIASYLPFGKLGVYLFIMITGYFVGSKQYSIKKSWNKVITIWSQTWFYSVIIFFILIGGGLLNFNVRQFISACLPFLTDQYWFVDAYIILLLLIPFINKCINSLSKSQLIYLIVIISFLASFLAPIKSEIFSSEIQFGYILPPYLIGAFLNKYEVKIKYAGLITIAIYCLVVLCAAVLYQTNHIKYINSLYFGIFELIMATLIFISLKNRSPFHNHIINMLAKTVFASYLITDNMFFKAVLW